MRTTSTYGASDNPIPSSTDITKTSPRVDVEGSGPDALGALWLPLTAVGEGDVIGDTATLDGDADADGVGDAVCAADDDGVTATEGDADGDGDALCATVGEAVGAIEEEAGLV